MFSSKGSGSRSGFGAFTAAKRAQQNALDSATSTPQALDATEAPMSAPPAASTDEAPVPRKAGAPAVSGTTSQR